MKKALFVALILGVIGGVLWASDTLDKDMGQKSVDMGKKIKELTDSLFKKEKGEDAITNTDETGKTTANTKAVTDTVSDKKTAPQKPTTPKPASPPRHLYCVREETRWIGDKKWTSCFVHNYTCTKFKSVNGRHFKTEKDLSLFLKRKEPNLRTQLIDCDICGGKSIP